jgi:hypothetical protein
MARKPAAGIAAPTHSPRNQEKPLLAFLGHLDNSFALASFF